MRLEPWTPGLRVKKTFADDEPNVGIFNTRTIVLVVKIENRGIYNLAGTGENVHQHFTFSHYLWPSFSESLKENLNYSAKKNQGISL